MRISYLIQPLFTFVAVFLLLSGPHTVSAQETNTQAKIEAIQAKIQELNTLVTQRMQFGLVAPLPVEEDIEQYFFLRESSDSQATAFAGVPAVLKIETDGGVKQLLLQQDCSKDRHVIFVGQTDDSCMEDLWLLAPEEEGGVVTYEVVVELVGDLDDEVEIDTFACRFNGCETEDALVVSYRDKKNFMDYLSITNRYEFEYTYKGENYFVQEILFDFKDQWVRNVHVHTRCEARNMEITTFEDLRFACSERKSFGRQYYKTDERKVDEEGNEFNVKLEFVSQVADPKTLGSVISEFTFVTKDNRKYVVNYTVR